MRICCTIAFSGCGIGLIICTFIPPENQWTSTIFMIIALCFLGFSSGGFPKSAVIVSQQKPAFVMGVVQASVTLGLLSGSFFVPGFTPGRSFDEYTNLFRFYGVVLICANIFFFIFCKAEPEDFRRKTKNVVKTVGA